MQRTKKHKSKKCEKTPLDGESGVGVKVSDILLVICIPISFECVAIGYRH
jgi:hypothetical protein